MQAADQIKFLGAGVWTYRVVDLEKFGIEMGDDALAMLTAELNGVAKPIIQSRSIEDIVTKLDQIQAAVMASPETKNIENRYGIEIISFKMTDASYPQEMNEKSAEAKGIRIRAQAVE
ncbi:hypothetical protein D6821_02590, partial [Candidatus Parcubacteria bacterium]